MNNFQMLPKRCHEDFLILKNPVFMRVFSVFGIIPTRWCRWAWESGTHQEYLDLVSRIRAKLPDASLTTDILIGFPGETEEDFDKTVELMEKVRYQAAYMYYYNPREGTPAAKYPDQIPLDTKKARLQRIIDMQLVITREETAKRLGQTVMVLAETVSRDNKDELLGKTAQDERVVFAAPEALCGSFVQVQLLELTGNTIRGKVVEN